MKTLFLLLFPVLVMGQGVPVGSSSYCTISSIKGYDVRLSEKGKYYQVSLPVLKECQNVSVTDGVISVTHSGNYLVVVSYDREGYNNHLLKFKITADVDGTPDGIKEVLPGDIVLLESKSRIKLWVSCSSKDCYTKLKYVSLTIIKL